MAMEGILRSMGKAQTKSGVVLGSRLSSRLVVVLGLESRPVGSQADSWDNITDDHRGGLTRCSYVHSF